MNANRQMYADLKEELLLTREQIAARVQEMGRQITEDFRGRDLTVICILKGAVVCFVDLVREIDLPMTMDFMAISSYGSATKSSGVVRILKDLEATSPDIVMNELNEEEPEEQVSLLDVQSDAVGERLRQVNIDTMTPLEALNLLYELKQMVN